MTGQLARGKVETMKAITTRYKGPTNTRGSRIIATAEGGHRVTIPYPHELSGSACHAKAAEALAKKVGWTPCKMIAGGTENGWVFVFSNSDTYEF